MDKKEPQPSPYMPTPPTKNHIDFLEELDELCRAHGISQHFIAFADGGELVNWKAFSNSLNKPMVEYLELIVNGIRKTWEDLQKKK